MDLPTEFALRESIRLWVYQMIPHSISHQIGQGRQIQLRQNTASMRFHGACLMPSLSAMARFAMPSATKHDTSVSRPDNDDVRNSYPQSLLQYWVLPVWIIH
jgi:hypothetical protein